MAFSDLGLSDKVLAAVTSAGYTTPTPIQEQAIPHVLMMRDVLGFRAGEVAVVGPLAPQGVQLHAGQQHLGHGAE